MLNDAFMQERCQKRARRYTRDIEAFGDFGVSFRGLAESNDFFAEFETFFFGH